MVLSSADIFFQNQFLLLLFSEKKNGNISRVSSSLDPDHAVGSDLGLNCLQKISADDTSK